MRLFSEHGVGETSIRDIARASGVSLAMVHHYYFSKEKLLGSCIASVFEEMTELQTRLEDVVARATTGREMLHEAVVTGFRFARERRELIRLLLRITIARGHVGEGEPVLRRFLDVTSERFGQLLSRPAETMRLPLQSILYLIARYAVQADAEMQWVVGPEMIARAGDPLAALEMHVADAAWRVLGMGDS